MAAAELGVVAGAEAAAGAGEAGGLDALLRTANATPIPAASTMAGINRRSTWFLGWGIVRVGTIAGR